jgi:hypothetical protein
MPHFEEGFNNRLAYYSDFDKGFYSHLLVEQPTQKDIRGVPTYKKHREKDNIVKPHVGNV